MGKEDLAEAEKHRVGKIKSSITMRISYQYLLSSFAALVIAFGVNAQSNVRPQQMPEQHKTCAHTAEATQAQWAKNPALEDAYYQQARNVATLIENSTDRMGGVITIPVVWHIVNNGEPVGIASNISEPQIRSAMDVINEMYSASNPDIGGVIQPFQNLVADMEIQFCLAKRDPAGNPSSGVNRFQGSQPQFTLAQDEVFFKQGNEWDPTRYLNIFVVTTDLMTLGTGFAPGFGNPQWLEGVAVDFFIPGRAPENPFTNIPGVAGVIDQGKVLAHEIGHYLFLDHPAGPNGGQGCIPENGVTCQYYGDRACDTPVQDFDIFSCDVTRMSCGSLDMMQNTMQVSPDPCSLMFTPDQRAIAKTFIQQARPSLFGGNQCEKVFRAINIGPNFATLDWSGTLEAVSYNVQWNIIGQPFGSAGFANTGNNATQFNPPGLLAGTAYGWQVQAVFGNGTTGPWEPPMGATFRTNGVLPPVPCPYDPNEGAIFGPYLGYGQAFGIICPAADLDRFVFMDQMPERSRLYIQLTGVTADYDMDLTDLNGNILAQALTPGIVNEQIIFDTPQAGQNYYVWVYAKPGQPVTGIPYFLNLNQIPLSANPPRMADPDLVGRFDLFPNPATDIFKLEFYSELEETATLELLDVTGRVVYSKSLGSAEGLRSTSVNVSHLPQGMYICTLQTPTGVKTKKLQVN